MARIRSIHPGLFTDESWMEASPLARLMLLGIWCESFDDGVFEWKPITLKAKIFPGDNVDTFLLLDELKGLDFVTSFEAGGKRWGAIRNFCRFQRPKKPNSSGVITPEVATYTGLVREGSDNGSELVENQFSTDYEQV